MPKVIDVAPTKRIDITYPGGLKVNGGNELTPTEVKHEPFVTWEADSHSLYTLVMTGIICYSYTGIMNSFRKDQFIMLKELL